LNNVNVENVVALCTCQQSKDFPYCDNTHAIFNKATNSNISPVYLAFVEGNKCNECGAKLREKKGISRSSDKVTKTSVSSSSSSSSLSSSSSTILDSSASSTGCSITLSDCTNTDTSFLDNTTTTSSTTQQRALRRSLRKSSSSCQCTSTQHTIPPSTSPLDNETITHIDTQSTTKTSSASPTSSPTKDASPVILPDCTNSPSKESKDTTNTVTYTPTSIKDPRNINNIFTREEVALHNTQHDLWMIIKGNVYDITQYTPSHPGGVRALVKFAGKDGTENVQYHSSAMLEILNSRYYIGKLPREEGGPGGGCIIC